MKARHVAGLAALSLLWGSEWVLLPALQGLPETLLGTWRAAIAAVALALWAARDGRRSWARLKPVLWINVLLGVTLIAAPQLIESWRPSVLSPGLALTILALVPLLTALFDGTLPVWSGPATGGVAGICLLTANSWSVSLSQWPSALAFLAAASLIAGSQSLAARWLGRAPVAASVCVQMSTAAVVLGLGALLQRGRRRLRAWRSSGALENHCAAARCHGSAGLGCWIRAVVLAAAAGLSGSGWLGAMAAGADGHSGVGRPAAAEAGLADDVGWAAGSFQHSSSAAEGAGAGAPIAA